MSDFFYGRANASGVPQSIFGGELGMVGGSGSNGGAAEVTTVGEGFVMSLPLEVATIEAADRLGSNLGSNLGWYLSARLVREACEIGGGGGSEGGAARFMGDTSEVGEEAEEIGGGGRSGVGKKVEGGKGSGEDRRGDAVKIKLHIDFVPKKNHY